MIVKIVMIETTTATNGEEDEKNTENKSANTKKTNETEKFTFKGVSKDIFRRNGKCSQRLPVYRSADVIVMIYNSDLGELSFELFSKKEEKDNGNDNGNDNEAQVSIWDS